jgi:hypothetical protein
MPFFKYCHSDGCFPSRPRGLVHALKLRVCLLRFEGPSLPMGDRSCRRRTDLLTFLHLVKPWHKTCMLRRSGLILSRSAEPTDFKDHAVAQITFKGKAVQTSGDLPK